MIYSLAWYLAFPLVVARLLVNPQWRGGWRERFGLLARPARRGIWVHAASVGEVQAALPLVQALRIKYPDLPLAMTAFTPSGREHAQRVMPGDVRCALLPFDYPGATARFIERLRPRVAIVIETELWPNLFAACGRRRIPLLMVSARVTDAAMNRYRRWAGLIRHTLEIPAVIAAQTDADATRLLALGADPTRVTVGGNIKFDFRLPDGLAARAAVLRTELAPGRPVWIAASTHPGEEEAVLAAHREVVARFPDALLVLAPRHPGRSESVAAAVTAAGFSLSRRSNESETTAAVYLLDTLGELALFYGAADAAFVGGTLVPIGGHNLLEPAAFGVPMVCGPHIHGIAAMHALLDEVGAVQTVHSGRELGFTVGTLLAEPASRARRGGAAREVLERNRGAVARVLHLIEGVLR